ncbi:MAG: hypothetical protein RL538_201 [Candidatus Parcubacteria bacterium]|jgi:hypothetical protein
MKTIKLHPLVGTFGENKDVARDVRVEQIVPILEVGKDLTLDFEGVDSVTQSFCHALISELIRNYGVDVLDRISFANCTEEVKAVIGIVVDYMQ